MSKRMRIGVIFTVVLSVAASCLVGCTSKSGVKKLPSNPIPELKMISIPAGKFMMGSNEKNNEKPIHNVYLDAFQIGKYEVTVAQYRKFCKATGREMPMPHSKRLKDDYPMTGVTWNDASAFCKWAGGRLPSEAEWEKAARGTDGRKYPWGNTWEKTKCANAEINLRSVVTVGSYPADASPYDCVDMAGNAWEWCADWYSPIYYKASPSQNPKGPSIGGDRVIRGGGCNPDCYGYDDSRCAYRNYFSGPNLSTSYLGFRLARSTP